MSRKTIPKLEYIEVSRLRGIKVLYKNDLYELARIVLKIMEAKENTPDWSGGTARPTIVGLANDYEYVHGSGITSQKIIEIVKAHGLKGNEVVDFDQNSKQQRRPTRGTQSNEGADSPKSKERAPTEQKRRPEVD